jgi:hypothetical protein
MRVVVHVMRRRAGAGMIAATVPVCCWHAGSDAGEKQSQNGYPVCRAARMIGSPQSSQASQVLSRNGSWLHNSGQYPPMSFHRG